MTERNAQVIKTMQPSKGADELRLFPFIVAGLICFAIAIVLGSGSWVIYNTFRSKRSTMNASPDTSALVSENAKTVEITPSTPAPVETPAPPVEQTNLIIPEQPATSNKPPVENVVEVAGGEVVTGGGENKQPLQRHFVSDFYIAETEVTNAQYAEFLKETNYPSPPGWNKTKFPPATENFPVTNVSWRDAAAFCEWMSKKIGLPVRLPTEAEWELAARGREAYKYSWGNDWNKEALASSETGGKVSAVKSFPLNRSPFGAFDMTGSVWEWTENKVNKDDEVTDEAVKEALASGQILRVVKGGSAGDKAAEIFAQARYEIPERTKDMMVGFRYVVEKK